jgi:hypothetical protein
MPGHRGIVAGIKTEVPATLLDSLSTVRYNVDTMHIDDAVPHPSAPTISGLALEASQSIPAVTGTARAVATITNVGVNV